MLFEDTIAAISTPVGVGGIGVIRVSGKDAVTIVDKIYRHPQHKSLENMPTHTIHYGHIVSEDNEVIDEVLVMLMKEPKTFTRENVVEINCHGGPIVLNKVLIELIKNGARLAENGEFTKRAFLNGRIDLSQVEAIMDIIEAKTDRSLTQAVHQLEGRLSKKIKQYQEKLLNIIASIEVSIDYPEYDNDDPLANSFKEEIIYLNNDLKDLLMTADTGKMIREGVKTAIVGRPNVGKSSLLNALLEENKAIVTDIPGTTRDIVEAYLNIDGIPFLLLDTAGIRETEDIVEKIGVEKSKNSIDEADLILVLLDNSRDVIDEDIEILKQVQDKEAIYVLNKIDLESNISQEIFDNYLKDKRIAYLSAKTYKGLDQLKGYMKDFIEKGSKGIDSKVTLTNNRQKQALIKAIESLDKVIDAIEFNLPEDLMAIDLHDAYGHLGMIVGEAIKEDIISQLFSRFCLGK
jgi:tRNA modification GTPase